jgi:hypothetical protein
MEILNIKLSLWNLAGSDQVDPNHSGARKPAMQICDQVSNSSQ